MVGRGILDRLEDSAAEALDPGRRFAHPGAAIARRVGIAFAAERHPVGAFERLLAEETSLDFYVGRVVLAGFPRIRYRQEVVTRALGRIAGDHRVAVGRTTAEAMEHHRAGRDAFMFEGQGELALHLGGCQVICRLFAFAVPPLEGDDPVATRCPSSKNLLGIYTCRVVILGRTD